MSIEIKQLAPIVLWKGKPIPELEEAELREALNWAIEEMRRLKNMIPTVRSRDPLWGISNAAFTVDNT